LEQVIQRLTEKPFGLGNDRSQLVGGIGSGDHERYGAGDEAGVNKAL
jgi:hypothetical protein